MLSHGILKQTVSGSNRHFCPLILDSITHPFLSCLWAVILAVATSCLCCNAYVTRILRAQVSVRRLLPRSEAHGSPSVCQSISTGDILKWLCDSASSCHSLLSFNKGGGMKPSAPSFFLRDNGNILSPCYSLSLSLIHTLTCKDG